MEREIKNTLKKNLKGIAASTLEMLARGIGVLPSERVWLTTDIVVALAATNLRATAEMLKVAPDVSRLIDAGDARVWGEIGKRLSATSQEAAFDFFQSSPVTLEAIPEDLRSSVLRLANKQAALSANTAIETFKSAPRTISSIRDHESTRQVLNIALELARHSVKHSNDLFSSAPQIVAQMRAAAGPDGEEIQARALALTAAFAFRSGGTAAEFFTELPSAIATTRRESLQSLFEITESYLDRSGGVALQYFKAASRVLAIAGDDSFRRWTSLARRVALQGNAASYHFMKASPQIVGDLASRAGDRRSAQVVSAVLEIVEEIADKNTLAAIECFNSSPVALRAASIGQFREWARRGIEGIGDSQRRTQAYYALESKASQEALLKFEGGLTLDSVGHTLRLYVEGLTGRQLTVAPLSSIPDESKIGDGKTIYLPSVVAEFEDETENFRLFKVLAAHAAGQIEFKTYAEDDPATLAAMTETRDSFSNRSEDHADRPAPTSGVDFLKVLGEYPNTNLALRVFTTIENGRVDYLLRLAYRGIRRDLDIVRARLVERRPRIEEIPQEFLPFELLFQIAIAGGATAEARRAYPTFVGQLERIVSDYVFNDDATVGDSLMATRRIYDLFVDRAVNNDVETDQSENSGQQEEGEGEQPSVSDPSSEQDDQEQELEASQDPFSFWATGQASEISPDHDLFDRTGGAESTEQDLEKGDRAFYYDEWDRELGDYRTRWCRVIERISTRGGRGFVETVRSRYGGIISSIRYQFQMLRPENLKRLRGEVDGEDYDLQAVIDYALDKRSTGLIDDRLYTRKLRRERDVAVSFLLDMSSSTARTISRFPNNPYTQPGQRIIDIEKEGLVLMSEALEAVGDQYSMQGFTSEGRRNVKFYIIKDFGEAYSPDIERRIGGVTYQNNTRLGAAIRHAASRLSEQEARTKLLIILSDGRPYDHDYGDSRYAREDTRMALRKARIDGITPFCITIDRESEEQLRDMYGEVGYTIIDDVLSLPERLPGIYSRLTT